MAESTHLSNSNGEDDAEDKETASAKRRAEIKELRGKIQSLKKSVPKGDKKKKREVAAEITKLEQELKVLENIKANVETSVQQGDDGDVTITIKQADAKDVPDIEERLGGVDLDGQQEVGVTNGSRKKSRAQKRKDKKSQRDRERDERITTSEAESAENNPRLIEREQLKSILEPLGLVIKDVPSDGHCLYAAVSDQLSCRVGIKTTITQLRVQCSEYILAHSSEFLPYLTDPDTGDQFTQERFKDYCDEIAHTAAWGGQLEIRALSSVYQVPVRIYQAISPVVCIGEEYVNSALTLSYHHHEFGLGEHYNSVILNNFQQCREVLRGKLHHRLSSNRTWKVRVVVAHCGVNSLDPSTPCSQILLYKDYPSVGQKPKDTIKLEDAKIGSSYFDHSTNSVNSSPGSSGRIRSSMFRSGYSSGGSGSGIVGSPGSGGSGILSSSVHVFSVTTKSKGVHEFLTETENERLQWVKILNLLVMFPRSSIPEEPKTNPMKDAFRLRLEAVQYGANSVWPVYILPDEVGLRCDIIGTNVLALKSGVHGKEVGTLNIYNPTDRTTPLVSWDRDRLRRSGKTGNLVFLEIGRRCLGGPGLVWMYCGFSEAHALRETLHNFLFKGDGSAVAIPTQQSTLYDVPRASFDSSPRLEGPPVRLDKHPSIRRKRYASKPREIRRSDSTTSPMGSLNGTSPRSWNSFEPIFNRVGSSSPRDVRSNSHSPRDECDHDVVGYMNPDSEYCTANLPMYNVVPPSGRVIRSADYELMINPRSSMDTQGGNIQMSHAPLPVSESVVPQSHRVEMSSAVMDYESMIHSRSSIAGEGQSVTPKLPDIIKETETVMKKWKKLGLYLGIPYHILEKINMDQQYVDDKKMAMFNYWLENESNPSWEKLADAITKIGEDDLAAKIVQEYCQSYPEIPKQQNPSAR